MRDALEYDILVIGAGGGANIVRAARRQGKRVAVVEKDMLGGTCLNRGCIPSKMLIHPADVAEQIVEARKFDIKNNPNFTVDFEKLTTRITKTVTDDSLNIAKTYQKLENVDYYKGTAKFVSDKVVRVGNKHLIAKKIVIGVGARPLIPPIPGLKDVPFWTSTEALRAKKLPKNLIVIGGGYIGVELGHAYSALGSKVHYLSRGPFVAREDKDVIETFTQEVEKRHDVSKIVTITDVQYKNKVYTIKHTDEDGKTRTVKGDGLLLAAGVRTNNDTLALENTGIKLDKRGFIKVNKYMETDVKDVYAIGDCVGNYMFRHSVNFETEYLIDIWFNGVKKAPIKYPPMPHAIFTSPQIAGVGYTEQELEEKKIPYVVGFNRYMDSAMGMAIMCDYGFVKLLFHKKTQKLLGAHIIGPEASNMIHMLIVYMTMGAKLDDLLKIIYVHPALPEIVRNAARKARAAFEK